MDGHGHSYCPSSSTAIPHRSVAVVPDPSDLDLLSQAPTSQSLSAGRVDMDHLDLNSQSDCFPFIEEYSGRGRGVPVRGHRGRGTVTTVSQPATMGFVPHGGSPPLRISDSYLGADSGMGSGSHGMFFGRGASTAGTGTLPLVRITGDEEELDDEVEDSFPFNKFDKADWSEENTYVFVNWLLNKYGSVLYAL
ncbi:hypothetical protein GUJ93_ZPchr0007g3962 [Zizania palustris]|uniref:Uncharacterized protein n=1 Tax=Zizania palustris TaxID=103762 RepID=A0A8J5T2I5_ZIZPA|nr:hypothetical protein GUJ93_ZPchr0007g3962 [Zizania palustris]